MAGGPAAAVLAALAALALAGCVQQEAAAPAPPPAATPAPLTSDQNFVDRAALGTGTEVELGRLASTRAASPAVRAFADRIITDHRQAHARLTRTERSTHIAAMPAPPPPNALTAMSGPPFDRAFMQDQINNHPDTIRVLPPNEQTTLATPPRNYSATET